MRGHSRSTTSARQRRSSHGNHYQLRRSAERAVQPGQLVGAEVQVAREGSVEATHAPSGQARWGTVGQLREHRVPHLGGARGTNGPERGGGSPCAACKGRSVARAAPWRRRPGLRRWTGRRPTPPSGGSGAPTAPPARRASPRARRIPRATIHPSAGAPTHTAASAGLRAALSVSTHHRLHQRREGPKVVRDRRVTHSRLTRHVHEGHPSGPCERNSRAAAPRISSSRVCSPSLVPPERPWVGCNPPFFGDLTIKQL